MFCQRQASVNCDWPCLLLLITKYRLNIDMICHCNTETNHTDNRHVTAQNHKQETNNDPTVRDHCEPILHLCATCQKSNSCNHCPQKIWITHWCLNSGRPASRFHWLFKNFQGKLDQFSFHLMADWVALLRSWHQGTYTGHKLQGNWLWPTTTQRIVK